MFTAQGLHAAIEVAVVQFAQVHLVILNLCIDFYPWGCHFHGIALKVVVYSLLMNYSYETFYYCWAESILLAQISMM